MRHFLICLLLLLSFNTHARTSLWKISHGDHTVFLGGTIHVLTRQQYPLPLPFTRAYRESARIVFETDISQSKDPLFFLQLKQQLSYTDGKTLSSDINNDTLKSLQDYCTQAGIPYNNLTFLKAPLVSLMLTAFELQKLGIDAEGVDQYFYDKAVNDSKQIDELESLQDQLRFIRDMGKGNEDALIMSTIKENIKLSKVMRKMTLAWRSGETLTLEKDFIKPMKKEFPQIYREMLVDRNNNWLPKIRQYLTTPETELVLVGALHLTGDDGLIHQLRQSGYIVEQW